MTITLPTGRNPVRQQIVPVSYSRVLKPVLGGATQVLNRLGSRFAMVVEMGPMLPEPWGRLWSSALTKAYLTRDQVVMPVIQQGLAIGSPGSPTVVGTPAGSTLPVTGATSGHQVKDGQYLSLLLASGKRYLHQATADATLTGGAGDIPIQPMIHDLIPNGTTVEIAAPKIQGTLIGDPEGWTLERIRMSGFSFRIEEDQ